VNGGLTEDHELGLTEDHKRSTDTRSWKS